ncbi:exodeoxyribonuclease VII large subunit [Roseateles amylovorans]|uniref:Exodeoxyribonuclease 7 large subunit n=1 Tax=Roseateles amylovorans TaxID=2978473 RepID=A0ABY6B537_9BURK|nr:exodeoxyribonuclease VII large subunit [Roseateles amylovorans]UXH80044.1 exodeoxyribonuclease VII large subunit [Roseateles amylovorans]
MIDGSKPASARMVWGVGALLTALSDALQARFPVLTVQGELSGFTRATSGHCYFSLKDADGQAAMIRCAMFRRAASLVDFSPRDGQSVEIRGRVALYEPRGELQFVVEAMRRSGEGALYEQFLRLKARLEAQGLFDPDRKRVPPTFARRIGVITSTGGAALHDVLTALARRAPHAQVFIYPSLVQGAEAPAALVRALNLANDRADAEVLLLVRGGGSLEDLWAFNDERVVQTIAESPLPVICGVGHETDVTLADLAADLRAPTPTAAAELATVSRQQCLETLAALERQLHRRLEQRLDGVAQRLDRLALRLARPGDALARQRRRLDLLSQRAGQVVPRRIAMQGQRLDHLAQRLARALPQSLQRGGHRLESLGARLQALDPRQVLARGYAWLDDGQGHALASIQQLSEGQDLRAVLADGEAQLRVQRVHALQADDLP